MRDAVKKTKKNRQTGTTVSVWRPGTQLDKREGWLIICEDHGGCYGFNTRSEAVEFSSKPLEWCECCLSVSLESEESTMEAEAKRLARIFNAHDADEDLIWLTLEDHEDVDAGTFTHAQLFNAVMANL